LAVILGKRDNLHEIAERFDRRELKQSVFLNSVPKSGTHLIRNVMRMFVPEPQQWHKSYIQIPNIRENIAAWRGPTKYLSWGHMLFSDDSVIGLQGVRHVVLVRDPYDWILARARFYLSDEFQGSLNHIKNGAVSAEEIMNMMIFGVHTKAPSLLDIFQFNAAAWLGTGAYLIRYEDLNAHSKDVGSKAAERYFGSLLDFCGVDLPDDWRERVETGADPKESRTARENLNITTEIPNELPATQKRLVDFAAPGLRALLGYA
jgi:hypothetical protein